MNKCMDRPPVITIDGPTASGKGTVAAEVARVLRFHCLDSGLLYRIVAFCAQQQKVNLADEAGLVSLIGSLRPRFEGGAVWLDGQEIGRALRTEECGHSASKIAALAAVRTALLERQRAYRQPPGLVADGRDMGTVVFPEAEVKVYLTATANKRAERRYNQLIEKGISANLQDLVQEIQARDARDMNRAVAPLVPAKDAVVIDSTQLGAETVIDRVVGLYHQRFGSHSSLPS